MMVHRLRKEYLNAIHTEISQTVPSPEDLAAELRYLIEVLS
ncbi:MAG: hypothetical protein R3F31_11310 [Verrucomicrobiales bacterium]